MNKTGILTFHNAPNYGAVFQCYALQETVKSLGAECEIINYQCDKIVHNNNPDFIHKIPVYVRFYKFFYRRNRIIKRYNGFKYFANQYLHISAKTYNAESIRSATNQYDRFIVGSDQVWNLSITGNDFTYYLDFVSDKEKKYSYAASFGNIDIISSDLYNIQDRLSNFSQISCREKSALRLLDNCNVRVDVDPVLLLKKEQWEKMAICSCSNDYILVYMVQYDWDLLLKAVKSAQKLKYKIVLIYAHFCLKELPVIIRERLYRITRQDTVCPNEFLGMVKNAKIMITNSFHGTIFSLIFHKQLIIKIKTPGGGANQRISDLLNDYGIDHSDHDIIKHTDDKELDWIKIDNITEKKRKASLAYIKMIVQKV